VQERPRVNAVKEMTSNLLCVLGSSSRYVKIPKEESHLFINVSKFNPNPLFQATRRDNQPLERAMGNCPAQSLAMVW